jgi:hypothetical protein
MRIILTSLLLCFSLNAAVLYDVRCPVCLDKQVLKAASVATTGAVACTTNINGVEVQGSITTQSANFHCKNCHADFIAQIKPDKFVPLFPATAVVSSETVETDNAAKNYTVIRDTFDLPDGTRLVISTNAMPNPIYTMSLSNGTIVSIYWKK